MKDVRFSFDRMNPLFPERIINEKKFKKILAPPCIGEALRRGTLA